MNFPTEPLDGIGPVDSPRTPAYNLGTQCARVLTASGEPGFLALFKKLGEPA
jgi:hypothetical protein